MALKDAVLAALLDGEASGYELSKRFAVGVANFWSATPQQVYRELERLEADGLIVGRVVEQERRPNKRVLTLTDAGRDELRAFTAEPSRPMAMRDEFVVKLQAIDVGDAAAVKRAAAVRLEEAQAKLDFYDRLRAHYLGGRDEAEYLGDSHADRIGPILTLMGGRMLEELNVRWMTALLEILERREGGDEP